MQICVVDILNFIFRLGVVFAIFGFLWWLINLGLFLLRAGRPKTKTEHYIFKFVQYILLVDVTMMFCLNNALIELDKLLIAALILLMYFVGNLQNEQMKQSMFQMRMQIGRGLIQKVNVFDLKSEILVIGLSIVTFVLLIFFPQYASNPISLWFYESIVDIEDTSVFGFIFKIIGFFFMVRIILKVIQSFTALLLPKPKQFRENNDDDYDDYTEIK